MTEAEFAARRTLILPAKSIEFAPGTAIGEYTVSSLMAEGSQATLFRVNDRARTAYVMRVYFDGCAPEEELTRALLGSGNAALCSVKSTGEHDGHQYDVVPSLRSLPNISALTENEQIKLLEAEASAIKSFHETGFCHYDIKAEHFMCDSSGVVKLIDIGSAKKAGAPAPENPSMFLPPDAHSGTVKKESDLFSFGVAILEQYFPNMLKGKSRAEISRFVASFSELQNAAERLPPFIKEEVKLLLSDDPGVRNECEWFSRGRRGAARRRSAESAERCFNSPREKFKSLNQLTAAVKQELLAVAVFSSPEAFAVTAKNAARSVDFQSSSSLSAFLTFLRGIPKSTHQVNYTSVTADNAISALKGEIITDCGLLSKANPAKTLRNFKKREVIYIFEKQLIEELDEQSVTISQEKERRAFAALRIIGIVLGIILGIGVAIAAITAIIYILISVIIGVFIIVFICALLEAF